MRFNEAYTLIGGSGSTSTSYPVLVNDFRLLTLSFLSNASLGASRFTIQVSNADGLQNADLGASTSNTNWSVLSGVNMIGLTPGMVTLDPPGYRWLRVTIEPTAMSAASVTTIILNGASF